MKIFAVVLVTATAFGASWVLTRWASSPVWHRVVVLVALPAALVLASFNSDPLSGTTAVIAVLVGAAVGATFRPRVSGREGGRSTGPGQ
ncbi:MAG TPA: hypothetical protein PLZ83_10025 [Dermatophilaceae bacterium]|jgi:uncharacterized membrane protein YoaK (UPF0700 family)|uniref:Uncharacterized protein n=1 Tax=Candidatus Phosphoribacter hodrii TaxID=2953743 RepID=A0A9D7TA38_9MICO|nr:hypothetical protein [Candidatus Phosphoribacter hodrii]MBP8838494.1 hypothetical protein [Dermatophilaceae bacterium]OPZ56383.1 MAG: hypothetical protein BWY91_00402 [bacterium ADurb.BinA028]HNV13651.1 hypothetical protein [Dermatophilaceae bacterium]HOA02415.1 hypothetical protein [Dermatophilaceae bacterium]